MGTAIADVRATSARPTPDPISGICGNTPQNPAFRRIIPAGFCEKFHWDGAHCPSDSASVSDREWKRQSRQMLAATQKRQVVLVEKRREVEARKTPVI